MRAFNLSGREIVLKTLISIFIAWSFLACSKTESASERRENSNANQANENAPVTITVDKSVGREIPAFVQATGSLIADETSDIAPKAAGKVVNVSANVGQFVRQGSVIARIDDRDARLRLAEAQAGVTQAIAGVRQAEARLGLSPSGTFNATNIPEVRAANANYEQTVAELRQAEANEKRYRELVETGDVSLVVYEQYRTQRDTARARLNARNKHSKAPVTPPAKTIRQLKRASRRRSGADAGRNGAASRRRYDYPRAVFGFISNRPVAVGEYVTSATPVATLLRVNPIKLQIQVAEADVPFITLGRGISIEVDAYKDRKFSGAVTAVNPAIDPGSRAAIVEAAIENGNNALRSGMFATVRINREGGSSGVFVPKIAVFNDESTQSYRVFVIQENVAKLRVVQLGTEENEFVQIINGVNADEIVVTSNLAQLYEGAKVQF
jgi:multidrug efflux pump subunit AcrA (membrane-fusion protein)